MNSGRLTVDPAAGGRPRAVVLLFHGAGGGIDAPVLVAARDALVAAGFEVARFEQPYRVAGRRAPAPAPQLDAAALPAAAEVRRAGVPLVLGGKSSGARVACRIATAASAAGVVALGFPLHPPGRPERSRRDELEGAGVPVLVTQGTRDAFGTPDEFAPLPAGVTLHPLDGCDHGLKRADCVAAAAAATVAWIRDLVSELRSPAAPRSRRAGAPRPGLRH